MIGLVTAADALSPELRWRSDAPWDDLAESETSPKVLLKLSVRRHVDALLGKVDLKVEQEAKHWTSVGLN